MHQKFSKASDAFNFVQTSDYVFRASFVCYGDVCLSKQNIKEIPEKHRPEFREHKVCNLRKGFKITVKQII